ncbi:MAG: C39 family peptidase [Desulfobacterium sp.]|nr:C39 family peptidase [Desulfobacterium sp.]
MHVILAAAILTALITTFSPRAEIPELQVNMAPHENSLIRFREDVSPREKFVFDRIVKQEHDFSCGSAALATLLNYGLGEKLSETQVIRGLMKHGDKEQIKKLRAFSLLDMKLMCKVLGYDGAGYKAEIEDIKNPEYWPCIVPIKLFDYRHFVVLKGVHDGHVFLADPFRGNISYSLSQFKDAWYENVIFLVSSETLKTSANMLKLTRADLRYISEDTAWDMIKNIPKPFEFPAYMERDDIPGEKQFYRP